MSRVDGLIKVLRGKGIRGPEVLAAIRRVPRDLFVPEAVLERAFEDTALTIGHEQTISQPFVVARMTELVLAVQPRRVLEIGTGSGYQAAVLAQLVPEVYSIERVEALHRTAVMRLEGMNLTNVHLRYGDGNEGWVEFAPYDAIIATAATDTIPAAWRAQLRSGGIIVAPIGQKQMQYLQVVRIENGQEYIKTYDPVSFVPLLSGQA